MSTADAELRVMKMADGEFRPACTVPLTTDVGTGCIVGVDVTNHGTDQPHLVLMLDDIEQHTGRTPGDDLVDGGFVCLGNVEAVAERGATLCAPPAKSRSPAIDPCEPREDDTPAVVAWRVRVKTESAKRIYVQSGAVAERTNADPGGYRRLDRLNVRRLVQVRSVVLIAALIYNLLRIISAGITM